jgi:alpha-glutamyl/putrescinyl thymine pyrophosphorylase-like protein
LIRPRDVATAKKLEARLHRFHDEEQALPGIVSPARRTAFLEQLIESIHRVDYVARIKQRQLSERRASPDDELFDPILAAIVHQRKGDYEEAFWLVFLSVHFGRNRRGGWRYAREVYGSLGTGLNWTWKRVSTDPAGFRQWLATHQAELRRDGVPGGFGNHRKYESLDAHSEQGTGAVMESYVAWVGSPRTHQELVQNAVATSAGDPKVAFDKLYNSMRAVKRFGRTARFDYLTMISKVGLATIQPGSPYLADSTGPLAGARLLFGSNAKAKELDGSIIDLGEMLDLGMQVMEDALCNWQKSPDTFHAFRL